jgi:WD repeat-containing protein 7
VAFSENGLMIRWWSLGSAWWERLSTKSLVPIQCTKLIFIPPWEAFSPNSSRLSIMNSILGHDKRSNHEVCSLLFSFEPSSSRVRLANQGIVLEEW